MPTMTTAGYTPPKGRGPSVPNREKRPPQRKKKRRRKNTAAIVSLVIFLIAVFIGSATLYIYAQIEPYADTFYPGTSLAGYPLTGMTTDDASALLSQITGEAVSGWQFELRYGEKRYPLTAQDVSLAVDAEATLDPLWQVGRSGNMIERYLNLLMARNTPVDAQLVLAYDMEAVDALLEQVCGDVERDPVDATVTFLPGNSEPFRFTAESEGYVLDTAPLRSQIEDALRGLTSGQLDIEPEVIEPEIYQAELESATTLRGRVTMQLEADEAAAANAAVAAAKLNGLRVEAGETLSFNEVVGTRTEAAGYVVAAEPAYGPNVSGVGGGVCQVSSALYQAALLSGLEVVTRSAAVYPVSYCAIGQEAAVSDQGLDLVIRNSTQAALFVTSRIYADGDAQFVEIQFIGEPLDVRYALESQALETTTPTEPVYVRDSEGRYATYTDERVPVTEAMTGYSSLLERVTLDAQGNETARETISEHEYEPIPQAIYVGVTEREE